MVLDAPDEIARVDASGMLQAVLRLGPMVTEGWEAAAGMVPPVTRPTAAVVCGVGGSGIAGDLLQGLLAPVSPVPVVCVRDDRLPAWVGPDTLVFLCSYSGDTEETLACGSAAVAAGAVPVAVTSGGRLAADARGRGHPLVLVPSGWQPRAALPLLLMPLLRIAAAAGLAGGEPDVCEADVREAAGLLSDLAGLWGPDVASDTNPAKRLATVLCGTLPIIYSASPSTEAVARRWKTQLNENSKVYAIYGSFPEIAHNEVVGWADADEQGLARTVVVLRDLDDGPASDRRLEAARRTVLRGARNISEVWSVGEGRLARVFSLVLFGDLVSVYLAVLRGVDPTPVEAIDAIKQQVRHA
jgi:glucose/mannose-6-phosphate isomerase